MTTRTKPGRSAASTYLVAQGKKIVTTLRENIIHEKVEKYDGSTIIIAIDAPGSPVRYI
jgi:hypothetical protein